MNDDGPGDIRTPLRGLRNVKAPEQFETLLYQQLRSLTAKNPGAGWFARPAPLILLIGGLVFIATVFLMYPFGTSNGVAPHAQPVPAALSADSLATDSTAVIKTHVNTSKLP